MEQFGKYSLIRKIGTGGMAEVFLARTTVAQGLNKTLVIKKIHTAYARSRQFVTMFVDEAKIALGLNHPNIIQVFDFGAVGDTYFLAMEHVEGMDLLRLLQEAARARQRLPYGLSAYIVQQLAKGLDYAHRKTDEFGQPLGIVHRDISPQNILLSWDGGVKIVDFGIARARDVHEEEGVIKGKFAYMSPEQARGEPVDCRSDVFAAGIVLFELVCARPLFHGKGKEALEMVKSGAIPRPRDFAPELPETLERIILQGARVPSRRSVPDRARSAARARPVPARVGAEDRRADRLRRARAAARGARAAEQRVDRAAPAVERRLPRAVRRRRSGERRRRASRAAVAGGRCESPASVPARRCRARATRRDAGAAAASRPGRASRASASTSTCSQGIAARHGRARAPARRQRRGSAWSTSSTRSRATSRSSTTRCSTCRGCPPTARTPGDGGIAGVHDRDRPAARRRCASSSGCRSPARTTRAARSSSRSRWSTRSTASAPTSSPSCGSRSRCSAASRSSSARAEARAGEPAFEIEEATAAFAHKLARQARGAEILVGGRVFRAARARLELRGAAGDRSAGRRPGGTRPPATASVDEDTDPGVKRARVYRLRGPKERAQRLRERARPRPAARPRARAQGAARRVARRAGHAAQAPDRDRRRRRRRQAHAACARSSRASSPGEAVVIRTTGARRHRDDAVRRDRRSRARRARPRRGRRAARGRAPPAARAAADLPRRGELARGAHRAADHRHAARRRAAPRPPRRAEDRRRDAPPDADPAARPHRAAARERQAAHPRRRGRALGRSGQPGAVRGAAQGRHAAADLRPDDEPARAADPEAREGARHRGRPPRRAARRRAPRSCSPSGSCPGTTSTSWSSRSPRAPAATRSSSRSCSTR